MVRHTPEWRGRYSQDRLTIRREWVGWFLVHVVLALSLLVAAFVPWFTLDDTDAPIAIIEVIPYALDGPDRIWLLEEAQPLGAIFLWTPFLLVPFLFISAISAARDTISPQMYLISLAGYALMSFGASVAIEEADHTMKYGFVITEELVMVALLTLLGFSLKRFEARITVRTRILVKVIALRIRAMIRAHSARKSARRKEESNA